MSDDRWRVQGTWTVGEDARSYAPQYVDSEAEAEELRAGMEETLAHFPTLEVLVERVSVEDVPSEDEAEVEPSVLHLLPQTGATTTACGLSTDDVTAVAVDEIFALSDSQCP